MSAASAASVLLCLLYLIFICSLLSARYVDFCGLEKMPGKFNAKREISVRGVTPGILYVYFNTVFYYNNIQSIRVYGILVVREYV